MTLFPWLMMSVLLISCGKKIEEEQKSSSYLAAEAETQAHSEGVSVSEGAEGSLQVVIPASRRHNPSAFQDGWFYFPRHLKFVLPETLQVEGSADHFVVLKIEQPSGVSLNCIYEGKGQVYAFDFCVEAQHQINSHNRTSLRLSSAVLISRVSREISEIHMIQGERILLHIPDSEQKSLYSELSLQASISLSLH